LSQTVYVGRNAQFAVSAVGSAPLSYQWRTNGVAIGNGGNVAGSTTATLTITNLTAANATPSLDVVISNSVGSTTSSVVSLTVIIPNVGSYESDIIGLIPVAYYRRNLTDDP